MISVVTATFNASRFIERAVASKSGQGGAIEHVVVDGGSSDGTVDLCRGHADIQIIEAPGSGIYEAWNIGITATTGDIVMFLNSDDELEPGAFIAVEDAFARNPDADIVAGAASVVDDDRLGARMPGFVAAPNGELDIVQLTTGAPAINAMAFRRSIFVRYGLFDTCYGVAGDRAFLLRMSLAAIAPKVTNVEATLYRYHVHAGSLTLKRGLEQRIRIARAHIALSNALLRSDPTSKASAWLRHMRVREMVVAALYCISAGQFATAWGFIRDRFRRDG